MKMMSAKAISQAASYEQKSGGQRNAGLDLIDMLGVERGSAVLDLGCGTGNVTKVLSERVGSEGKVVAVDPDGERLKIAREKYSAQNIEYVQADDKTFPPGQYDLVFCNAVIHWIGDKRVFSNTSTVIFALEAALHLPHLMASFQTQ